MEPDLRDMGEVLSEYLDGELPAAEHRALEARLRRDPALRRELELLRRVVRDVGDLPVERPRPGFRRRALARIQAVGADARAEKLTPLWMRALPVAAMVLVVIGLVFAISTRGPMGERREDYRVARGRPVRDTRAPSSLAVGKTDETQAKEYAREGVSPVREQARKPARPMTEMESRTKESAGAPEGWIRHDEAERMLGMRSEAEKAMRYAVQPGESGRTPAGNGLRPGPGRPARRRAAAAEGLAESPPREMRGAAGNAMAKGDAGKRREEMDAEMALDPTAAEGGPAAHQVLTIETEQALEVARLAMALARNNNALAATVPPREAPADEGVVPPAPRALGMGARIEKEPLSIVFAVPRHRYDEMLKDLAALTPPERSQLLESVGEPDDLMLAAAPDRFAEYRKQVAVLGEHADQALRRDAMAVLLREGRRRALGGKLEEGVPPGVAPGSIAEGDAVGRGGDPMATPTREAVRDQETRPQPADRAGAPPPGEAPGKAKPSGWVILIVRIIPPAEPADAVPEQEPQP